MKFLAIVILWCAAASATVCQFTQSDPINLVPPYDIAFCYDSNGYIIWGVSYDLPTNSVYVVYTPVPIWWYNPVYSFSDYTSQPSGKKYQYTMSTGAKTKLEFWVISFLANDGTPGEGFYSTGTAELPSDQLDWLKAELSAGHPVNISQLSQKVH